MKIFVLCHIAAFALGWTLDLLVGDPTAIPHPICAIGRLIGALERALLGSTESDARRPRREFLLGVLVCAIVLLVVGAFAAMITIGAFLLDLRLGVAVEAILTCYLLAAKCLRDECMKVHNALTQGTLDDARTAVSTIVGRDVQALDASGVTRAAVETAAENASDGVVAPMLCAALGGPILGFLYKAVNTMDSMLGYHNERYEYFGKASAKLDDVVNFLPSRICALLMIAASFLCGKSYSGARAWRIFRRDRFNHKSPNSAQTESVCAGALGVRLAGDAFYFGKLVKKPFIGDDLREIEPRDIPRACRLMLTAETLCAALALTVLFGLWAAL